ncbi:hexose kinase [Microbacterium sp. MPKO10]|uniref:hexose kinase n=1 Tax=Microbacterium sp. MPKO10 TaxID=2989818 RepID=UPI0022361BFF|nr:hexose kinase [Microbacterium sp. MPKO10]MCW4457379.1 hexose kinase [Microbacterium sp. MPKO10]
MIVTLTAHPSFDKTIELGGPLAPGHVHTALGTREDAGGKGVNVSRAVAAARADTVAVLPLDDTDPYDGALRDARISARRVPISGAARSNITLVDPEGETTKVNLPGATLGTTDAGELIDALVDVCGGADWLVIAGSLPPGASDDFYVNVITAVRERLGTKSPRIAVDTAGAALHAVVTSAAPDLVTPNAEELAELVGAPSGGTVTGGAEAALALAEQLVPGAVRSALITLGADGAVLVDGDGTWVGTAPAIRVASTVGAGDSALAGYLLAHTEGRSPEERLRRAIQYGAAAAALPGTQPPSPHTLPTEGITIHRVR